MEKKNLLWSFVLIALIALMVLTAPGFAQPVNNNNNHSDKNFTDNQTNKHDNNTDIKDLRKLDKLCKNDVKITFTNETKNCDLTHKSEIHVCNDLRKSLVDNCTAILHLNNQSIFHFELNSTQRSEIMQCFKSSLNQTKTCMHNADSEIRVCKNTAKEDRIQNLINCTNFNNTNTTNNENLTDNNATIIDNQTAVCGNNICEPGETNICPPPCHSGEVCAMWACREGTCPSDCVGVNNNNS